MINHRVSIEWENKGDPPLWTFAFGRGSKNFIDDSCRAHRLQARNTEIHFYDTSSHDGLVLHRRSVHAKKEASNCDYAMRDQLCESFYRDRQNARTTANKIKISRHWDEYESDWVINTSRILDRLTFDLTTRVSWGMRLLLNRINENWIRIFLISRSECHTRCIVTSDYVIRNCVCFLYYEL